jgi:hypothetical protein
MALRGAVVLATVFVAQSVVGFQPRPIAITARRRTQLSLSAGETLDVLQKLQVQDVKTGRKLPVLSNKQQFMMNPFQPKKKTLLVIMPALGDFDTAEYAEQLCAVEQDLVRANIDLKMIGIGDQASGRKFCAFNKIPSSISMCVDPMASLHSKLNLHRGPNWDVPSWIPNSILQWFAEYTGSKANTPDMQRDVARSWLNYMAMCAGIAAPDTLPEILRGYFGDKNAPERLGAEESVSVGDNDFIVVKGTTDVKLGPIQYQSLWKNEAGYQRPAELATVRLRAMVEVLTNFDEYVPDQSILEWRGATFLFSEDNDTILYEHRDTGVLAYSKTMPRPLAYLQPYIGDKALNPLQLGDSSMDKIQVDAAINQS